jgi:phosphomannomutase/molybdopterin-guanine dinucleotide biosynthesis protein A
MPPDQETRNLKVIVLAGGKNAISDDGRPLVLEMLQAKSILEHVLDKARLLVQPEDLYVVVGHRQEEVRSHTGNGYHYVSQNRVSGTGVALRQVTEHLTGYTGDLLVLSGDTPLLRVESLRGMLRRHRLRGAQLTFLTAKTDLPLPYSYIVRSAGGQIVDLAEHTQTGWTRTPREVNAGAYIIDAEMAADFLARLEPTEDGEFRLTDALKRIIANGAAVESYRIYDASEVQGINTREDLATAENILEKRLYRPRRHEEKNEIRFGTGGWRALIGEGFTLHNVRRLTQAIANEVIRQKQESRGVIIGFDRRFLSREAAEAAAEVLAGNNIASVLMNEDAPTPLITYSTAHQNAIYGLTFTASHNPPQWNGLKVFQSDGSLLSDELTRRIEREANDFAAEDVVTVDLDVALDAGIVEVRDFTNEYVDAIESLIDLESIRGAGLRVIVDPMYGVGQFTLGTVLTEARCRVTFIHERHNPLFGGRSPAPNEEALRLLSSEMHEQEFDLGLAMDGDADRVAILDENGRYISTNGVLLLLYWYLHEVRKESGGVVRNISTTHLLDRLARCFGEECHEVPVGFKHIAATMLEKRALLGGESSGGLTIRGHIRGKDGIFGCALVVEMLARTKRKVSDLLTHVHALTGELHFLEEVLPATPEMRIAIPRRIAESSATHVGRHRVVNISHVDGTRLLLENDNWALLRFSGTEPVLRLTVEADTRSKAEEMMLWLRQYAVAENLKSRTGLTTF